MNIAEQKLDLFRQIDELPEESLAELKKIIARLRNNAVRKPNLSALLASWDDLEEDFPEIQDAPPSGEDIS